MNELHNCQNNLINSFTIKSVFISVKLTKNETKIKINYEGYEKHSLEMDNGVLVIYLLGTLWFLA